MWSDPKPVAARRDDYLRSLQVFGDVAAVNAATVFQADYCRLFSGIAGTDNVIVFPVKKFA